MKLLLLNILLVAVCSLSAQSGGLIKFISSGYETCHYDDRQKKFTNCIFKETKTLILFHSEAKALSFSPVGTNTDQIFELINSKILEDGSIMIYLEDTDGHQFMSNINLDKNVITLSANYDLIRKSQYKDYPFKRYIAQLIQE